MGYQSVVEAVFRTARETPDKLCIADGKQEYSYSAFAALIHKYAAFFFSLGIGSGSRVVVEGRQRACFPAAEFGLHLLGAVFVPTESGCSTEKLAAIASRCGAEVIMTVKEIRAEGHRFCRFSDAEDFPVCEWNPPEHLPRSSDISEILFSTGTTGKEKGIVLSHGNDVAVAENILYGAAIQDDNVEIIPSPLNHSHGLRSFYANMLAGSTVVLHESILDMKGFFGSMDRYGVNAADLVPSALSMILKFSGEKLGEYRNKLRFMEFGSAAMSLSDRDTVRKLLPGVPLYNFYGSTESGRAAVFNFNAGIEKPGCIGKPTHNSTMVVVDAERRPIASSPDNTGLLAAAGGMNMLCYLDDPEETSRATDGVYVYSGDEAYIDADGDIILLGRKGDVINIGGKKVAPDEIENAAKLFSGIADCGCTAIPDLTTGQAPKLFVQLEPGTELNKRELLRFLGDKLEPFKVPKQVAVIDEIPRTFNGKLLRRKLQ